MNKEFLPSSIHKRPFEIFGLTEQEHINDRITSQRFGEILNDDQTILHEIKESSNDFGEFQFVTVSRPASKGRICMTFYGLGYHEYRERWITDEWFWYQSDPYPGLLAKRIEKAKAQEKIEQRSESIRSNSRKNTQSWRGNLFETLADLTDEDGAAAEIEDLESYHVWLNEIDGQTPPEEPIPRGEYLLDRESRDKLPPLHSGESLGLDALAQVKFYTPDSDWTWYASEFDGDDSRTWIAALFIKRLRRRAMLSNCAEPGIFPATLLKCTDRLK